MTAPVLVAGFDDMRYPWPGEPDLTVPRVSSIIGVLGSKVFENLAAKQVARKAVTDDVWHEMPEADAIKWLEESRWDKANFGRDVHRVIQEWLDKPTLEISDVQPEHLDYLTGAIAFLNEHVRRVIHVEKPLFNRTYEYAGTADAMVKMRNGEIAVIDWKTGDLYGTYALQLIAYMNCEEVLTTDGHLSRVPPITAGFVVQLPGDGTFKAHKVNPTPRAFRTFIALRSLQLWRDEYEAGAFDEVLVPTEEKGAS